ncbi:MAG: prolyl oligopeptidase family serine peptidase [Bacteroidales bacterium]|jgi:pimeloyl-ACP methyl ester carboxylesterase|nr:prolyl oligopeptidase family serine peptidase [Bacteroidales bacterium]
MGFNLFIKIFFTYSILITIILSCSCPEKKQNSIIDEKFVSGKITTEIPIPYGNDTIIHIEYDSSYIVSTIIKYPSENISIKGTILMLHGWNLPPEEWCENSSFCEKALNKGYVLVIPHYGKGNYILEIYPETILDYRKYPTLEWIKNFQIPYLRQQFGLFHEKQDNFVAGISTGARGATLLTYHMPEIFKGVASLSGDFDITKMPDEYLYYSYLGYYKDFTERWKKECFAYDCKNYKVPTYIGHGKADNISPPDQSIMMYDSLKKIQPDLKVTVHFPEHEKHDYIYWESETDNILNFFDSL